MAVLLTILKITGIVLLGLIGLVLFILAVVLFVPIRYKAVEKKEGADADLSADLKVSWLLYILFAKIWYDNGFDKSVRVFGIKIFPRKEKKVRSEDGPDPRKEEFEIDWNEESKEIDSSDGNEETRDNEDKDDKDETVESVPDENAHEINIDNEESGPEDTDDDLYDQITEVIEKIISKFDSLSARYEKLKKELRFWKKYADDEHNRIAVEYIKKRTIKLLKKIAPKKIKGFVHFGFEDPATTGSVLVFLSLIYPVLPKKLKIDPGFEDTDIYGDVVIKGKIRLINIATAFLGVWFNRDCRRMWQIYKKHKEKY